MAVYVQCDTNHISLGRRIRTACTRSKGQKGPTVVSGTEGVGRLMGKQRMFYPQAPRGQYNGAYVPRETGTASDLNFAGALGPAAGRGAGETSPAGRLAGRRHPLKDRPVRRGRRS